MPNCNITGAGTTTVGNVNYAPAVAENGGRGVILSALTAVYLGAVAAKDPNGISVAQTTAGAANLTITGALASGGVATMDAARGVSFTSTGDLSGVTFTVTGTDHYGNPMVEDVAGPNNTTVFGVKAFKTVTQIAADGAVGTNVTAGSSDVLGLPLRLATLGRHFGTYIDGITDGSVTVVAGLATATPSTATTADVRGTVTPNTAPDGTKVFSVLIHTPDPSATAAVVYGNSQYAG